VKFVQLNRHLLKTTVLIGIYLALLGALIYSFVDSFWIRIALFSLFSSLIIFLVYRSSLRQFILEQLNKVYDSPLFDNEPFLKKESRELDFESFLIKIKRFAESKHAEIEHLTDRDDFRREFMGDVSHELKTPLFSAQSYILTILDGSMNDKELEKKYLSRAKKSLDRLTSIVNDLDTLAKLETGLKLDQQPFNIVQCISDVIEMLEFSALKKNITLGFGDSYDYPIMVKADREKIEQVLINMIQNSINYGSDGGQTSVLVQTHSIYRIRVEVKDDGVGIEKGELPRLFERFYRVDKSRSRDHGGSGLGLAIVKHILEAHDQEILVESTPGSGSTFSFTLNKAE
jgi:two-component system phosphate regulon sensor histidine kinase PhoR